MKTNNQNFLRNRLHVSGYGVTIHTSGYMGEETHASKQSALEAGQRHAFNGASATVFPRRTGTFNINGARAMSVYYFTDRQGLQTLISYP